MIKVLLMDIDGVLTDGKITLNAKGEEYKRICFKDIDAFNEFKNRGLIIGAITGEDTPITEYIKKKVAWDYFYSGSKDKVAVIEEIRRNEKISLEEICYVGDGKYDVSPLSCIGLALCPHDAIEEVKNVSDIILSRNGGDGCIWEIIKVLDKYNSGSTLIGSLINAVEAQSSLIKSTVLEDENMAKIEAILNKLDDILNEKNNIFLMGNHQLLPILQYSAMCFNNAFESVGVKAFAEPLGFTLSKKYITARKAEDQSQNMFFVVAPKSDPATVNRLFKNLKEKGDYIVLFTAIVDNHVPTDLADICMGTKYNNTEKFCELFIFLWHYFLKTLTENYSGELIEKRYVNDKII